MLSFIYNYRSEQEFMDNRNIHTRRHDGILFKIIPTDHFKIKQDPLYRATTAWNELPVNIRNANTKDAMKKMFIATLPNPYAK